MSKKKVFKFCSEIHYIQKMATKINFNHHWTTSMNQGEFSCLIVMQIDSNHLMPTKFNFNHLGMGLRFKMVTKIGLVAIRFGLINRGQLILFQSPLDSLVCLWCLNHQTVIESFWSPWNLNDHPWLKPKFTHFGQLMAIEISLGPHLYHFKWMGPL
jgi:hypothetical protein